MIQRTLVIFILACILASVGVFAQSGSMKCSWCGKPIVGEKYIFSEDKFYHESCYFEHVALRCDACGEIIEGEYVIYEGKNYHPDCYRDKAAMRCSLCGQPLIGEYIIDYWGNKYCAHHKGHALECRFCGRLIADMQEMGGAIYDDNRGICPICGRSAITDLEEANAILEEVRTRLARLNVVIPRKNVELHLTDPSKIAKHYGMDLNENTGFVEYNYEKFIGITTQQKFDVYILNGMPRMHFIATAAHELMHIWQYVNCPMNNDQALCEGSCNYAAAKVLEQIGGPECEYILHSMQESDDPIYGEGYRKVTKLARSLGDWDWLDYLKKNKGFPEGH